MPIKMIKTSDITKFWTAIVQLGVILVALYASSFYSYVLFHTLAEIASVVLAVAIFLVAWNARRYWNNNYYIILGFTFLFVGLIDLMHAFEYKGVGIMKQGGNSNIATQLWLAGRYLIAVSFLFASFFNNYKIKARVVFSVLASLTAFLFLSIFYWDIFPDAYVEGRGITEFKKISEYVIVTIFLTAFYFFYRKRKKFHGRFFKLLSLVLIVMVFTEISFTLYVGVYDFFNLFGHLLKIIAYYLAYLGIVEFGLMRPYQSLFKDLKDKENVLLESEQRHRSFVEFSPDAIVVHSGGTIEYANNATMKLLGVKEKNEITGKPFASFFHNDYHDLIKESIWKIENGQTEEAALAEMKVVNSNKKAIDVEVKGLRIMINGRPAIESIISDITERKRTQEKITHLASFPELNPNPIIEINSKGEVIYSNPAMASMLKELNLGEEIKVFFPADLEEILKKLKDKNGEKILHREIEIGQRTFTQSISLNRTLGVARLYMIDITERKQAEDKVKLAMNEWVLMFNSISDPAFILGTDHIVKYVNKAMCEFAGAKEHELIGKKCFEFMHKKSSPWKTCPMKTTCESKKPHSEEIYEPTFGKTLLVTTSPILDEKGEIIGILHIAKDITEKKEIEKAKDEFISLASHQLRTPLSSISLASELLLRGSSGKVDPEQKEMLDEIYQSTKRMSLLIEHMLNVSRVELGTLAFNPQQMEVSKQIELIIGELESQIKEKKLILEMEIEKELPTIKFDANILRIIAENLLTNAIRYTESGGKITVSLSQKESRIILSVCDTGCGIPEKQQKMIFQKAFRAENAKRISSDGHGLGMYMVKEVVDKSGAEIRFVSKENEGTTFFVSLPIVSQD